MPVRATELLHDGARLHVDVPDALPHPSAFLANPFGMPLPGRHADDLRDRLRGRRSFCRGRRNVIPDGLRVFSRPRTRGTTHSYPPLWISTSLDPVPLIIRRVERTGTRRLRKVRYEAEEAQEKEAYQDAGHGPGELPDRHVHAPRGVPVAQEMEVRTEQQVGHPSRAGEHVRRPGRDHRVAARTLQIPQNVLRDPHPEV